MKIFALIYCVFFLLIGPSLLAQNKNRSIVRCATDSYNKQLLKTNPNMMGSQVFEDRLRPIIEAYKTQRNTGSNKRAVITIPVVVHVFHNGEDVGTAPNITDAQVQSQIAVLNKDYRNKAGSTIPVAADVELEFCLAKQDESGCPINGINRIDIGQDGIVETDTNDGTAQMDALKRTTFWDPSKYLNLWTVAFNGGSETLGYAQTPGGPINTDGVVVDYKYFGSSDYDDGSFILAAPFDKGRTTTHEVGHFFSLFHTFEGGCGTPGDYCDDTPEVLTENSGCNPNFSCGSEDMIENYMDYTDDACMDTFTLDQKARIVSTIESETNRKELATSTVCNPPSMVNYDGSILIEGVFLSNCDEISPKVRLTNYGTLPLTTAAITYNIDGDSPSVFNWTGNLDYEASVTINLPTQIVLLGNHDFNVEVASPNGNTDQRSCNNTRTLNFDAADSHTSTTQVHLELIPDDYGSEITWNFKNSANMVLYSGGPYTDDDNTAINVSFDVEPNDCYSFTMFDSYGDGLCCDDPGSYTLKTDDETIIFSGGFYGFSETTNISTATFSVDDYFDYNRVKVYPNPTTNILSIFIANKNDLPDSYFIFNMLGQLIKEVEINDVTQLEIDATSISSGMYFIKINKSGKSLVMPFIKN